MSRGRSVLSVAGLLSVGLVLGGCSDSSSANDQKRGGERKALQYPVEVLTIEARDVEYTVSAVGSVEAFERVQVTARVPGVVERVRFSEGDTVKEGQVMVEIEPQRYRLAVDQAKASLQKSQVEKTDAELGLKRRVTLDKKDPGLMREEELETWRTKVGVAAADASERQAMLQMAELNLRDALVPAPINGVIQTRTVQTGQYVQVGAILATLLRREPLLLRFSVPDRDSARLKGDMRVSFLVGDGERAYTAVITYVAASASESSRMVPVTARVDDKERDALRPGAFARVTVPVGVASGMPVIPQTAVRPSERGFLAFVVEGEVAKERVLTLGMRTLSGEVEVRAGVQPGEKLVIRGAEALRDGVPVRVVGAEPGAVVARP